MSKDIIFGRTMLETITVALYENPIILFREYVQNSLDAYNKAIDDGEIAINNFHVTIDVNEEDRRIVIKDNGYGIQSKALFEKRMLTIGSSQKRSDRTKYIGFRGIGRISGLPFCNKLIFRNKPANKSKIYECVWEGKKYREELNNQSADGDLKASVGEIVNVSETKVNTKEKSKHYFEVILEEYSDDIKDMLENNKFKENLIRMLPLKYDKKFKGARTIESRYKAFMKEDLKRFMISVKYNGEKLFKTYDDTFILGSDIVFWEVRGKKKKNGALGDKIGLLWFTFEGHLKSNDNDQYYGILTRSMNVLMGVNDTFAQVADAGSFYVTTFREMAQGLRGVYGELLLNSQQLTDNSRRDWFLPDEHSRDLNNVIADFMLRLHQYRYCASRYFRKNASKTKKELKDALSELVDLKAHNIDYDRFSKKEEEPKEKQVGKSFAEEDIPYKSQSMRKSYDILMKIIEAYFRKIKKRVLFLKLRAFIVNYFENE